MGRWRQGLGLPRKRSTDVAVRIARAQLAFLVNMGSAIVERRVGCVLIMAFGNNWIHRHAESAANRRTQAGVHPPFPTWLEPMRRKLAHGGAGSFSRERTHSLDLRWGRCSCLDSTYHGVRSAMGECKHSLYEYLESEAAESEEARQAVHARCLAELMAFLHAREARKPAYARCKPLYEATHEDAATLAEDLVPLLRRHHSVPPSGKGEEAVRPEGAPQEVADAAARAAVQPTGLTHNSRKLTQQLD